MVLEIIRLFQFPTGWNSTRDCGNEAKESEIVSIPNGMEFYYALSTSLPGVCKFQFPTGWNSTLSAGSITTMT